MTTDVPQLRVSEMLLANRLIQAVGGRRKVRLEMDPDSPWLIVHFDPVWGAEATALNGELEFGVWRRTLLIYRIWRGAAGDDPIYDRAARLTIEEVRRAILEDTPA